jgi:hypothetical protein
MFAGLWKLVERHTEKVAAKTLVGGCGTSMVNFPHYCIFFGDHLVCTPLSQGNLAHKKHPPPWDHQKSPGMGLLYDPTGGVFLVSEVPLYASGTSPAYSDAVCYFPYFHGVPRQSSSSVSV